MDLRKRDLFAGRKNFGGSIILYFSLLLFANSTTALIEIPTHQAKSDLELITTESVSQKEVPIIAELLVLELLKESKKPKWVKLPGGVIYCDIYTGNGKEIKGGSAVHLHLRGYLEDGTEFVNTFRERLHFFFTFNVGETIPGFEQGIASMRERGKRIVIIPPELAFGAEGYETEYIYIPPYSTLIYEVSLLFVREPEWDKLNMFK